MQVLLGFSRAIDWVMERFATIANLLIIIICVISAGNAAVRYLVSYSSNAWLEIQWYGFGAAVMLGGAYTLQKNEHVRVDLVYGFVSDRTKLWIDLFGGLIFLMPFALLMMWLTWPWFVASLGKSQADGLSGQWVREVFANGELSSNAGGLLRWPFKFLLPFGFFLLAMQGVSQIIKTIAGLRGIDMGVTQYERPLQ